MPTISVIMGVYNSQSPDMLKSAIQSILNQTFSDFEFIICNDCSTSSFIAPLLNEMASKDSRIVLISNETNSGLAATLNHCLSVSKGKYIARMDDDDISLPDRLKKEVEFLDNNPEYDLVGCNMLLEDGNKIWGKRIKPENPPKEGLYQGCVYSHPTIMFTRKMIEKVQGYSTGKHITRAEDYDLYCKMHENGMKGYNIQEYLYLYYHTTATYKKQKLSHRIDEYYLRKDHFKKLSMLKGHYLYLFKPILSGLTPRFIRKRFHEKKFSLTNEEIKKYNEKYGRYLNITFKEEQGKGFQKP